MTSTLSRSSEPSTACLICSGRLFRPGAPFIPRGSRLGLRSNPNLVAITTWSRKGAKKGWASLQAAAELCGCHANHTPEDLSKMARARVADFERDLDEAPGGFADELLCTDYALSRDELQWRHPRCLLEHTGKVEGTEFH